MNYSQKQQVHQSLCNKIEELYKSKNNDYGDSVHDTYEKFGMDSFLVRMYDKINRVYSLTREGAKQKIIDEKIEDTLLDLANYALIAIVELRAQKDTLVEENKVEQLLFEDTDR